VRVTIIPGLGQGGRIREIREDGNKLLQDVAGRPAILWQLDFVLPDFCVIACHPDHAPAVQHVVGTSAIVVKYKAHNEPWGLAKFMQDMTRVMDVDIVLSLLFCDTLLVPGVDYVSLTIPGTVVVSHVRDGGRFLNVVTDDNGKVVGWVDHPYDGRPAMATIGLYTLSVGEWRRALDASDEDNAGYKFLSRAEFNAIETSGWVDCGTTNSWLAANMMFSAYVVK